MTALCGGGPSDSRPGFNGGVYLGAQGISLILRTLVPEPVADAISAIVSADAIDLTTFCQTDPPPMPTPGPEDFVALLNPGDFVEYDRVRKLFIQWWEHIYWYQACECTSVPTPPLGPVTQPGPGGQNTGLPSGGVGNCYETTAPYSTTGVTSGTTHPDLTTVWLPVSPARRSFSITAPIGTATVNAVAMPAGVTAIFLSTQNQGATSPSGNNAHDGAMVAWDNAGTVVFNQQMLSSQATTVVTQPQGVPIPATAAWIGVWSQNTVDASVSGKVMSWAVDVRFTCAGSSLETPCCPPDPKLELKIDQLLELVVNLNRSTPVPIPDGWHDGVTHSGLRESGSFTIDTRAVGIRYDVTTLPSGVRVDPGNPDFYWDMGFTTPYALTSPMRGIRLVFLHQTFVIPAETDQIGYTLRHGTVLNATELLPTTS